MAEKRRPGARPRFAYLLFCLTMIPLALQTFSIEADVVERLQSTVEGHPELVERLEAAESDEELFAILPDGRFAGAHLPHETWLHWIYAAAAATAFIMLVRLLFEPGDSSTAHLLLIGAVTATVGIFSLLAFQWIAEFSQGLWVRGHGIVVALFYIVKLIGFSYHAALDPENGFWLSFLGFTFGVGLCEEVTKAFPIFGWLGSDRKLEWRGACALGLASGVGFGVAEGIMYSANYYNGVATGGIYFTRFISCVALHATWTASVAILAAMRQQSLNTSEGSDWVIYALQVIAVPAILHGLYDTLLKRDMNVYALIAAVASFAWLSIMIELARNADPVLPRRLVTAGV
jgi:RsiW-degrading membrane proteinase PrsW (M82 family)